MAVTYGAGVAVHVTDDGPSGIKEHCLLARAREVGDPHAGHLVMDLSGSSWVV